MLGDSDVLPCFFLRRSLISKRQEEEGEMLSGKLLLRSWEVWKSVWTAHGPVEVSMGAQGSRSDSLW